MAVAQRWLRLRLGVRGCDEKICRKLPIVVDLIDGAELHGAFRAGAWRVGDEAHGFLEIRRFDDGEAGEWRLGVRERLARCRGCTVPRAHGRGGRRDGGDDISTLAKHFVLCEELVLLLFVEALPIALVSVSKTQILHRSHLTSGSRRWQELACHKRES